MLDFGWLHWPVYIASMWMCVCVCVCVCVMCQRKAKDRADGMREKSAHSPRRDSNLYLWDTRPPCFRLHREGRHASRQSKQTLQTLSPAPPRNNHAWNTPTPICGTATSSICKTSAESDEACQRKTKDRADGMREKSAHSPRRDSNLYLWDTRPPCFQLHHEGRPLLRQSKQTLQALPPAPPRNNHAWNTPTPICRTATSSICKDLRWVGRSVSEKDER